MQKGIHFAYLVCTIGKLIMRIDILIQNNLFPSDLYVDRKMITMTLVV